MWSIGLPAHLNTPQPLGALYKLPNSAAFYQRGLCFYPAAPEYEPMNLRDLCRMKRGEITHLGSFNKSSLFLPRPFKT